MKTQILDSKQDRLKTEHRFSVVFDIETSDQFALDPVKVSIARLSGGEIQRMERRDLIDLVAFADLWFMSRRKLHRLPFMEQPELEWLALLARRSCRDLVNSCYEKWGRRAPFPTAA